MALQLQCVYRYILEVLHYKFDKSQMYMHKKKINKAINEKTFQY